MERKMIMKIFITTLFILCHGICLAKDLPDGKKNNSSLSAEKAAEMISEANRANRYYLNLNRLTSIEPDAAGELAKLKSESGALYLDGLTSINKEVAEELARFNGYRLQLNGLTNINNEVAGALANFQGKVLSLNGLASIDKEAVKELAKFKGDWLILGLTSLDKEDAREFARGEGNGLSFDRLSSIDKEVAYELSRFMGFTLTLDGLTSISKDVAHELAKLRPRYSNTPSKFLRLDGLTSISKEVAHELVKFPGQLSLSSLKSMNSEVAREFAQYRGNSLDLVHLESIALDDLNMLRSALRTPVYEDTHSFGGNRYMLPRKLKDGTDAKKKNGKLIQFHQDGSKMTETVYINGYVVSRAEWNEEGNLTKAEKYAVDGFFGMEGQSVDTNEENKDPPDSTVQLSETPLDASPPSTPKVAKPEREYPYDDLTYREGVNKERLTYAKGEEEPFTGVGVKYHSDGRPSWESQFINGMQTNYQQYYRTGSKWKETRFENGKPALTLTWDEDGNLIEKETF